MPKQEFIDRLAALLEEYEVYNGSRIVLGCYLDLDEGKEGLWEYDGEKMQYRSNLRVVAV